MLKNVGVCAGLVVISAGLGFAARKASEESSPLLVARLDLSTNSAPSEPIGVLQDTGMSTVTASFLAAGQRSRQVMPRPHLVSGASAEAIRMRSEATVIRGEAIAADGIAVARAGRASAEAAQGAEPKLGFDDSPLVFPRRIAIECGARGDPLTQLENQAPEETRKALEPTKAEVAKEDAPQKNKVNTPATSLRKSDSAQGAHHDFSDDPMIFDENDLSPRAIDLGAGDKGLKGRSDLGDLAIDAKPVLRVPQLTLGSREVSDLKEPLNASGSFGNDREPNFLSWLGHQIFPSAQAAQIVKDVPKDQVKKLRRYRKGLTHFVDRPIGMFSALGGECRELLDGLDYLDHKGPAFYSSAPISSTGYPELDVLAEKANRARELLRSPVPLRLNDVEVYVRTLKVQAQDVSQTREAQLKQFGKSYVVHAWQAAKDTMSSAGYCRVIVAEERVGGGSATIASMLREQAARVEAAAIRNTLLLAARNLGNKGAESNPEIFNAEESAKLGRIKGMATDRIVAPK